MIMRIPLDITTLQNGYLHGNFTVEHMLSYIIEYIDSCKGDNVWIHRENCDSLLALAKQCDAEIQSVPSIIIRKPLIGIPFAVKDNIDVAGMPTTAACEAFSYIPETSAYAVQLLMDAGAICLGKTNMDQFATGLTGLRSPWGVPENPFDKNYLPGGSSSGSAVAVSKGYVSFSLGTDTAGSGRVPAAFNNIVGLKPGRGAVSNRGVVPAVRSLDCVSVFSLSCSDAARIYNVINRYDEQDEYSVQHPEEGRFCVKSLSHVRVAVPEQSALKFFGKHANQIKDLFNACIEKLQQQGFEIIRINFDSFVKAAELLYQGPWIAERKLAFGEYLQNYSEQADPSVNKIMTNSPAYTAEEVFQSQYLIKKLRRDVEKIISQCDAVLLPTAGALYTIEELTESDIEQNTNLGFYTNFANLLNLSAIAIPAGFIESSLPVGITLFADQQKENSLLSLADHVHRILNANSGYHTDPLIDSQDGSCQSGGQEVTGEVITLCVVGQHMRGLALNNQLQELDAEFLYETTTSDAYRLYSLNHLDPVRPGIVRAENGVAQTVEIWQLSFYALGRLVNMIKTPLAIGSVQLASGEWVNGFVCEDYVINDAEDISEYGGWRNYLESGQR